MEDVSKIEGNSNKELKDIISKGYQDLFWQILTFLEVAFPHQRGDGSDNEKQFNNLRSKILRIGNDGVRELDNVFSSYIAFQLYEYKKQYRPNLETIIIDFRSKYKIGGKENGKS